MFSFMKPEYHRKTRTPCAYPGDNVACAKVRRMRLTDTKTRHVWRRIDEAAQYADVSRRTIERHLAAGTLTRGKFGRCVLVDLNELDALITRKKAS